MYCFRLIYVRSTPEKRKRLACNIQALRAWIRDVCSPNLRIWSILDEKKFLQRDTHSDRWTDRQRHSNSSLDNGGWIRLLFEYPTRIWNFERTLLLATSQKKLRTSRMGSPKNCWITNNYRPRARQTYLSAPINIQGRKYWMGRWATAPPPIFCRSVNPIPT